MARKIAPPPLAALPLRVVRLHGKLFIAVAFGILVLLALIPADWRAATKLLVGWDAGVALYLGLTQPVILRADVARIRRRAAEQDEGALAILLLTIVATLASLVAIVFQLGGSKQAGTVPHVLLAMATILLSWAFVHTIFSFYYAHEYYGARRDRKIGGLRFPGDASPDYWDFLYFSLVVGMTSQVSDVAVTSKVIRRMVAIHGVLSFFFNISVLALTVNIVSNLI